ncbi:thiaminase II [Halomonas litopenaei]|uniref:Aminopyrimidine aminohydrolase n=1 Tax=Halomonas litopenaei TaxID=2109328 RepID=A0ABX5J194_9GAMM|nr:MULTISPECIES: thiaminase II [Halomonas]PTL93732.1 thiaminase II [Halomonas sp. SYSU XM8]PTL96597.1 thiaminase II [Halomonas litopenaei]
MGYRFTDLVDACRDDWHAYIEHDFVLALGRGELADASFRHYLKQDYLFLLQFSRAYALAAYKSHSLDELRGAFDGMKTILDVELGLHLAFCRDWGIGEAELSELPEARATLAYTRYVLDAGSRGDLLDLHVALAPCMVGYADIARTLNARSDTLRGADNPFDTWIAMYESDDFQAAARQEQAWLDDQLAQVSGERFARLSRIFADATRLEIDFWQMGLDLSD